MSQLQTTTWSLAILSSQGSSISAQIWWSPTSGMGSSYSASWGMSAHFMSHLHMDHTVVYSLALCPPRLLVGPKTLTFHRFWPWTGLRHLTRLCLTNHLEAIVYKLTCGALVHAQWESLWSWLDKHLYWAQGNSVSSQNITHSNHSSLQNWLMSFVLPDITVSCTSPST